MKRTAEIRSYLCKAMNGTRPELLQITLKLALQKSYEIESHGIIRIFSEYADRKTTTVGSYDSETRKWDWTRDVLGNGRGYSWGSSWLSDAFLWLVQEPMHNLAQSLRLSPTPTLREGLTLARCCILLFVGRIAGQPIIIGGHCPKSDKPSALRRRPKF